MSIAEDFSGIDVNNNYVVVKKEKTVFCICVRSGLAINFFCHQ